MCCSNIQNPIIYTNFYIHQEIPSEIFTMSIMIGYPPHENQPKYLALLEVQF